MGVRRAVIWGASGGIGRALVETLAAFDAYDVIHAGSRTSVAPAADIVRPFTFDLLGDQLSHHLASLRDVDAKDSVVLMMEVAEETTYVRHHQRKIALILSAMRHFAAELRVAGWTVDYVRLDDPDNAGSFTGEVRRAVERHGATSIRIVEPGEWRVKAAIDSWARLCRIQVDVLPDDRFICSILEFQTWAQARNGLVME